MPWYSAIGLNRRMSFAFRWWFVLGLHTRINCQDQNLVLAVGDEDVRLKSAEPDKVIQESAQLALWGRPYSTQDEAIAAGERWMGWLQVAFACVNIGANLGRRAPRSAFTDAGLEWLEAQHGRRVLNNTHGLMVFEEERLLSLCQCQ